MAEDCGYCGRKLARIRDLVPLFMFLAGVTATTEQSLAQSAGLVDQVERTDTSVSFRYDTQQRYTNWSAGGTVSVSKQSPKESLSCRITCDSFSYSKTLFPHCFMVHIYGRKLTNTNDHVDRYFIIDGGTSAVSVGSMQGTSLSATVRPRNGDGLLGSPRTPPGQYHLMFLFGTQLTPMQLTPGIKFWVTDTGDVLLRDPSAPQASHQPELLDRTPIVVPPRARHLELPEFLHLRTGKDEQAYGFNLAASNTDAAERLLVSREGKIQVLRRDESLSNAVETHRRSYQSEPLVVIAMIVASREGQIEAVQLSAFAPSPDGRYHGTPSGGRGWMIFPASFKEAGARFAAEYGATDWYDGVPSTSSALILFESPSLMVAVSDLQHDRGRIAGRIYSLVPPSGRSNPEVRAATPPGDRKRPPAPPGKLTVSLTAPRDGTAFDDDTARVTYKGLDLRIAEGKLEVRGDAYIKHKRRGAVSLVLALEHRYLASVYGYSYGETPDPALHPRHEQLLEGFQVPQNVNGTLYLVRMLDGRLDGLELRKRYDGGEHGDRFAIGQVSREP